VSAPDKIFASIKDWSLEDRPREKLLQKGETNLSTAELLAILLGSGTRQMSAVELSRLIMSGAHQSLDQLGKRSIKELMEYKGIGEAKAITIVAAMELGRRRAMEMPSQQTKITCSKDVYQLMQPKLGELPHEEFWVLHLNNFNKVIDKQQVSTGGITGTLVDQRLVYKRALAKGAVGLILVHNHPSGQLKPSQADKALTQKIKKAGELLDIKILDHLIVTQHAYFSFADEALL
jgi:DNA repair protein radc